MLEAGGNAVARFCCWLLHIAIWGPHHARNELHRSWTSIVAHPVSSSSSKMASRALAVLCLLCGRTDAFVLTTGPRAASLRVAAEPEMVLAYKLAAVGVTAVVGGVMAVRSKPARARVTARC
jgi:hypothetical protein